MRCFFVLRKLLLVHFCFWHMGIVQWLFQSFVLVIASICNIKKLPICCTSTFFIWIVSEKHTLIGNRIIINKSANSLTGSAWETMITGRTQTGRRVWNISKLLHFMEMWLHKKNLQCKNCEAHLPTFHTEMPFNWKWFLSQKLSINSDS